MQVSIRQSVYWITRTAVMTALLVTVQFLTASFGSQYVTGSAVNLLLAVSAFTFGPATGCTVGVISPIFAFIVGVGPVFPPLVPFIIIGNVAFVISWFLLGKAFKTDDQASRRKALVFISPVITAIVKFAVLYAGVVLIALPFILNVNEKQSAVLSLMFSYPQLITALIGGALASAVAPALRKALKLSAR